MKFHSLSICLLFFFICDISGQLGFASQRGHQLSDAKSHQVHLWRSPGPDLHTHAAWLFSSLPQLASLQVHAAGCRPLHHPTHGRRQVHGHGGQRRIRQEQHCTTTAMIVVGLSIRLRLNWLIYLFIRSFVWLHVVHHLPPTTTTTASSCSGAVVVTAL